MRRGGRVVAAEVLADRRASCVGDGAAQPDPSGTADGDPLDLDVWLAQALKAMGDYWKVAQVDASERYPALIYPKADRLLT